MIRTVIIDDESDARFMIRSMLEKHLSDRVQIVGEVDNIKDGIKLIKEEGPDLVLLDIQMREGTGFDLLSEFDSVTFEVVFITAYDQYAIKAFDFSAFGYLLKPLKAARLRSLIDRLEKSLQKERDNIGNRLKVLVENYNNDEAIKKLVISDSKGFRVTDLNMIMRLEGDSNYTHFVLTNGQRITTSKTMGEYEPLLNDHGFYRIHQSTIVNLAYVTRYIKGAGGKVEMSDGETFNLSRYRKKEFLKRFR